MQRTGARGAADAAVNARLRLATPTAGHESAESFDALEWEQWEHDDGTIERSDGTRAPPTPSGASGRRGASGGAGGTRCGDARSSPGAGSGSPSSAHEGPGAVDDRRRAALSALTELQPPPLSARRGKAPSKVAKGKGKGKGKGKRHRSSAHRTHSAAPGPPAPTGLSAREISARNAEMARRRHDLEADATARRLAAATALAAGVL